MEVAASVTNISCIKQGWFTVADLTSRILRSPMSFLLMKKARLIFELRSVKRCLATLAEVWSLNGMMTRMVGVVVSVHRK